MGKSKIDLILNPIRLRLLMALEGRSLTPGQLSEELPDVAQATLYRHIAALEKAGLIEVLETRQVRGATERLLTLSSTQPQTLGEEDLAAASKEDHLRYFTAFSVSLLHNFELNLNKSKNLKDLMKKIGYHSLPVYIKPDELREFQADLQQILKKYTRHSPEEGGERFLFSTVLMPGDISERS